MTNGFSCWKPLNAGFSYLRNDLRKRLLCIMRGMDNSEPASGGAGHASEWV